MDCAEGSYTQLWDHFNCKKRVDEIIRRTNFVFITHIHGDHQLGILKIMYERDQLLDDYDENDKLYVITPTLMLTWVQEFVQDSLKRPEMVVLIPSCDLNPEGAYYYQNNERGGYTDVAKLIDSSREHIKECPDVPIDEINSRIE